MRPLPLLVLALAACGSGHTAPQGYFGPTIEPPRGLNKIQPGMTVLQAKRLVPELKEEHQGVREHLALDSGVSDVKLEVRVDNGIVSSIVAVIQGPYGRDLLASSWGPPQLTQDSLGQPETTWANESSGWKVKLDCLERNCLAEFVPYHVLTSDFFGAHVVPPGDLANLKIGMKVTEARKIAPGPIDVRGGMQTGVDSVREFVAIDDKLGVVRAIYLNLPQHAENLIADAWGDGWSAVEPVGKNVLVWPDPTTRWRATLRDALGYSHDLAYDNYLPAADLFGEQPDVIDAAPVLGSTVDEVKKLFPNEVTPAGRDLVLTVLPTEWERGSTKITLDIAAGHVRALSFAIPWKAHPEAKEDLMAMFTHKWGEPRHTEEDEKKVMVFREADPRVEIREDSEHGTYQIEIKK